MRGDLRWYALGRHVRCHVLEMGPPTKLYHHALLPWILLGIDGRRRIRLLRAGALRWLPAAIAAGALASLACFAFGLLLFGHSANS